MDDLIQVKEKHIIVLAPEFLHMDVAQFKAYVSCTVRTLRILPIQCICHDWIVLAPEFPHMDVAQFKAYVSCTVTILRIPPCPMHLPPLDCISERFVAPRLPFMQIRRLRHQMGGQVINVPVDVNNIVTTLPRQLDDDYSFNVHLKRNCSHKSTCLQDVLRRLQLNDGWSV
jgi:hypothetical protein